MKPKIYQFPFSPFCLPVMRALEAGGVDYEPVEIPSWDKTAVIEVTRGAYYQVPVIEHGAQVIYESGDDSQDVARYTDREFLLGRLFPEAVDGLHAIVNAYIENEVEAVTFKLNDAKRVPLMTDLVGKTLTIRHKKRKFGRGCVQRWAEEEQQLVADLTRALAPLESTLARSRFLFSQDLPVYADFLLYGMIGNLTYQDLNEIPAGLDAIARHYRDIGGFRWA